MKNVENHRISMRKKLRLTQKTKARKLDSIKSQNKIFQTQKSLDQEQTHRSR